MKREELKELGLNEEQIEKVMTSYGKELNEIKTKNAAFEEQNKALLKEKEEYSAQLTSLQDKAKDNEELKNQLAQLKTSNEESLKKITSDFDAKIKDIQINNYLKGKGARDVKMVKCLFGSDALEKVKVENNELVGMDEVFNEVYKDHEWAFEPTTPTQSKAGMGKSDKQQPKTSEERFNELSKL